MLDVLEACPQVLERRVARAPELRQLLELRKTDRRLHIGDLEVVAQMREHVLVVVPAREVAMLL